jgi:H+-translocating NAD(P) transhydrogenase subunit alpha
MSPGLLLAAAAALTLWAVDGPPDPAPAAPVVVSAQNDAHASSSPRATEMEEAEIASADSWSMLFVFVLSTFIGMGVIGRVSRLLHTPLMSLTNAISAIAIVGSIVVAGSDYPEPIRILGAIALFASMTNIVSGFLITDRMLKMFRQTRPSARPVETREGPTSGGPPPTVSPA